MKVILSIIVDKTIMNKKSEAITAVNSINSSYTSLRETSVHFKFRYVPITSVESNSIFTNSKSNGITITYGTLKSEKQRSHYGTRRYNP